jgi:hypothetical protein
LLTHRGVVRGSLRLVPTGERRRSWFVSSVELAPHSRYVAELFDIVCVVSEKPYKNDFGYAFLGLFEQPFFEFDFGFLYLGEVNRHRSSRLWLAVHLSLLVVSHLESPVLCRHDRLRLHPLQALKKHH